MMTDIIKPDLDLAMHVQLKNNILADTRYNDVMSAIITRVSSLPDYQQYRACLETLLFSCNLAENLVSKADNIDKNAVVCEALSKVFNLSELEVAITKSSINFLCSHNRVKKFSKFFFAMTRLFRFVSGN